MNTSELCAIEDNIKIEKGSGRGRTDVNIYCIPCDKCGTIVRSQIYSRNKIYLCVYCRKSIARKKKQYIQNELDKIKTKREQAFDKAIEKIRSQVDDFEKYEKHIKLAKTRVELYDSMPEMMVAIELLKLGYKIIPQQKIGQYRVDFLLPDEKMVIEVDGSIYHQHKYGNGRDGRIQLALGLDWKIIHIPAELITNHIQRLNMSIKKLATQGK